jgi:hypothetical protein
MTRPLNAAWSPQALHGIRTLASKIVWPERAMASRAFLNGANLPV